MSSQGDKLVKSPGEVIKEHIKKRGWSQEDLARILDTQNSRITELIQGKMRVSPEIAISLETAFNVPAEEWLRLDATYALSITKRNIVEVKKRARLFDLAPIKEMQKRGWIKETNSADELEAEVLKFYAIDSVDQEPAIHGAMRKTDAMSAATPAQTAWARRVRQLAAAIPSSSVGKYDSARIEECRVGIRNLAAYSSGIKTVSDLLKTFGIRFVVIEGLSGAKIDGFATWLDDQSPVIGMSLRFNRLDSFWFTLGHELIHIKYKDAAPIDADVLGQDDIALEVKPMMERRADAESAATFIPPDELESFIRRVGPLYSTDKINQFANRVKMHPQVIIGQLKHRGEIKPSAHNKTIIPVRDVVIRTALTDGWGRSIDKGDGL